MKKMLGVMKRSHPKTIACIEILVAVVISILCSAILKAYLNRPRELDLVFDGFFFYIAFSFFFASFLVALLIWRRHKHSASVKVVFGVLLLLLSVVLFAGLGYNESNFNAHLESLLEHRHLMIATTILILNAKNLVAFGFTAISAGIISSYVMTDD